MRKKKKYNKTIKGSGYIAKGNNACVFGSPPLYCQKKKFNKIGNIDYNDLVSKVFPPEYRIKALQEFEIGKIISKIDPENDICIYPLKIIPDINHGMDCSPHPPDSCCEIVDENQDESILGECGLLTQDMLKSGLCTIQYMKNGGDNLKTIRNLINLDRLTIKWSDIIDSFLNTLKNFSKFFSNSENGYLIHNDLNAENITYSVESNKFYLIDFGGAMFIPKNYDQLDEPDFITELLEDVPRKLNSSIFQGWNSLAGTGANGTTDLFYDFTLFIINVKEYVFDPLKEKNGNLSNNEQAFLDFLSDLCEQISIFTPIINDSRSNYKRILNNLYEVLENHLAESIWDNEIETIYSEFKMEQKNQINIISEITHTLDFLYFTKSNGDNHYDDIHEIIDQIYNMIKIIKETCKSSGSETTMKQIKQNLKLDNIDKQLISDKKGKIKELAIQIVSSNST